MTKKRAAKKRPRLPSLRGLRRRADDLWSAIIRARSPFCEVPGCLRPARHSHHLWPKNFHASLRWDIRGGAALCAHHHWIGAHRDMLVAYHLRDRWVPLYEDALRPAPRVAIRRMLEIITELKELREIHGKEE